MSTEHGNMETVSLIAHTPIELLITRNPIYWVVNSRPTLLNKTNKPINGLGNSREEAIGDFVKKIKQRPVMITSIYMDKSCLFTRMYCEMSGMDMDERL